MGLTVDQEHTHNADHACIPPIIRPHPLIYIFLLNYSKGIRRFRETGNQFGVVLLSLYTTLVCVLVGPTTPTYFFNLFSCFLYLYVSIAL